MSHGNLWNISTVKNIMHIKNQMGCAHLDNRGNLLMGKSEWQKTIWRLAISKYFPKSPLVGLEDEKHDLEFSKHCLTAAKIRLYFTMGTHAKMDWKLARFPQRIVRLAILVSLLSLVPTDSGIVVAKCLLNTRFHGEHGSLACNGYKANSHALGFAGSSCLETAALPSLLVCALASG